MNNIDPSQVSFALQQARMAIRKGDHSAARLWAQQAIGLDPNEITAWMILAGISSPEESIRYLKRVLEIAPNNEQARQGMHWAIQKARQVEQAQSKSQIQSTAASVFTSRY